jgi:tetratricopeptide (TPR) repeat protein
MVLAALTASGPLAAEPERPASSSPRPPSLLLITVDGLRPDALSCYGKGRGIATPHIDKLAERGRVFGPALAVSGSSLPSLATMLTGKTPFEHQVWDDDYRNTLKETETTLAERLRKKGYKTAAFLGSSVASGRGLDRGFDLFQDGYVAPPSGVWHLKARTSETVSAAVKSWIGTLDATPFFLWIHFLDPSIPGAWSGAQPSSDPAGTYAQRVQGVDRSLGEILDLLGKRPDYGKMVVALTADHALGLGDHGEPYAGLLAYESSLRIPLIVAPAPPAPSGARSEDLVGLVDLYPTLEKLLGLPPTPSLPGRDLLAGRPAAARAYQATALLGREVFGWTGRELIAQERWRLILSAKTELYDLSSDPEQKKDLSATRPEQVARMKAAGRGISGGSPLPAAHYQSALAPPAAGAARFKSLGLIVPTVSAARALQRRDPPADQTGLRILLETRLRTQAGGYDAVAGLEEALLKADPESLFTLLGVGAVLTNGDEGSQKKAADLLKSAQKLYPLDAEVYHYLGHVSLRSGRFDDAAFLLRTSVDLGPPFPGEVAYDLACAYAKGGKKPQALRELARSIQLGFGDAAHIEADPDLDSVRREKGYIDLMHKEFPEVKSPR